MNCLFLVLLLLCCGNDGDNGCGCFGGRNMSGRNRGPEYRGGRDREYDGNRDRNDGCGCNDRDQERDGCGCRNEDRQESRLESRTFIPYPGSSNGCDEPGNRGGCNCAD